MSLDYIGLVGKLLHLRDQVEEEASLVPGDALHLGGPVRAEVRVVGIDERPQVALLDAVPGAVVGVDGDLGAVAEPGVGCSSSHSFPCVRHR